MKYDKKEIGKIIRAERKKLGISQNKLGKEIGVVGKQISNYENGKLMPPIEELTGLCEQFGCELGYLLGEPDYAKGTRQLTSLSDVTGLTIDSLNNICKITGTEKQCIEFGLFAELYRSELNAFLSSNLFIELIRSLHNLAYQIKRREDTFQEIEQKVGKELYDEAYAIYENTNPYLNDENLLELRPELKEVIKMIYTADYEPDETGLYIKLARYELHESFERLIDSIYPRIEQ